MRPDVRAQLVVNDIIEKTSAGKHLTAEELTTMRDLIAAELARAYTDATVNVVRAREDPRLAHAAQQLLDALDRCSRARFAAMGAAQ